jgi:TonB family protein
MGQTKAHVAETGDRSDPLTWKKYSVKGEQFSVALPTLPAMDYRKVRLQHGGQRLEISLGSYANGVVYTVFVFENISPRESLDSFSDRFAVSPRTLDITSERKLTVDGVGGKAFTWKDGVAQFFAKGDRLFQFKAFGAPPDDKRIEEFFSSVSLLKNKDVLEVSDGPGEPYEPIAEAGAAGSAADQQVFVGKEVDKKVRLAMKPEPSYTEAARQHEVTGTVVIRCIFSSNGSVTNIRVVFGLPDGLTEKAVAAAKKIKFLPAMKDGKHVSMWMQLEYNFNLY